MRVIGLVVFLFFSICQNLAFAEECSRDDPGISKKEWTNGERSNFAQIHAVVEEDSNGECDHGFWDFGTDRLLVFDISKWREALSDEFDANQIVVYADGGSLGVLRNLESQYGDTGNKIYDIRGNDYCDNVVHVCVGDSVGATDSELAKIFLWNKSFPKNPEPTNESEANAIPATTSGGLAWLPLGVECQNATKWIDISTGNIIADKTNQSVSGYVVCENYGILPQCKM